MNCLILIKCVNPSRLSISEEAGSGHLFPGILYVNVLGYDRESKNTPVFGILIFEDQYADEVAQRVLEIAGKAKFVLCRRRVWAGAMPRRSAVLARQHFAGHFSMLSCPPPSHLPPNFCGFLWPLQPEAVLRDLSSSAECHDCQLRPLHKCIR